MGGAGVRSRAGCQATMLRLRQQSALAWRVRTAARLRQRRCRASWPRWPRRRLRRQKDSRRSPCVRPCAGCSVLRKERHAHPWLPGPRGQASEDYVQRVHELARRQAAGARCQVRALPQEPWSLQFRPEKQPDARCSTPSFRSTRRPASYHRAAAIARPRHAPRGAAHGVASEERPKAEPVVRGYAWCMRPYGSVGPWFDNTGRTCGGVEGLRVGGDRREVRRLFSIFSVKAPL